MILTKEQQQLEIAFRNFVKYNTKMHVTYGAVYFNLKEPELLDIFLKSDLIREKNNIEIGHSGSKIYLELFAHLYCIRNQEIKKYLISNFPKTFEQLLNNCPFKIFVGTIHGADRIVFQESRLAPYSDLNLYFRI